MPQTWCNWSGTVSCTPQRRERPTSEAQLAALLRDTDAAGLGVRVAGRGHSHAPLVATDALLLELLNPRPPRRDERILRRDEERVQQNQRRDGGKLHKDRHAPLSGARVLGGCSSSTDCEPV